MEMTWTGPRSALAGKRQHEARLAMLQAERDYKAARRAFVAACQETSRARKAERFVRANPALFETSPLPA